MTLLELHEVDSVRVLGHQVVIDAHGFLPVGIGFLAGFHLLDVDVGQFVELRGLGVGVLVEIHDAVFESLVGVA